MTARTIINDRLADGAKLDNLPSDVQSELDLKADKSNVLELDNTTPFTPSADNQPSTKKYTDDNAGGQVDSVVAGTNVTVDNTDPINPIVNVSGMGTGDVVGPASAVDDNIAIYDGITGKLIKDGGSKISDLLDKTTYDPTNVSGDVFDQDNMVDGTVNKNYTATEKTKLAGIDTGAEVNDPNTVLSSAVIADNVIMRGDGGVRGSQGSVASISDTGVITGATISSTAVTIALGVGSPTVNQTQEYIDNTGSAGFFLGGDLSDGGAGTLDVGGGEGFTRTSNNDNAELQSFKWSSSSGIAVTDNTTQYVYVSNAGVISLSTDEFLETPILIQIGVVTKENGVIVNLFSLGVRLEESIGQAGRFIRRVHGISRDNRRGGLIFGQSADVNRDVSITSGVLWWGRTEYPFASFDTSGADTFQTYSASGQENAVASQWPNEQFDSSGTLTTLGNNKWANLFLYIIPDNGVIAVYGRAEFVSEALAQEEGVPSSSLPTKITETGILASRFTFQKSSDTASISSAFEDLFANAGVTDHGNLAGLTDDDHTQYLLVDGTRAMTGSLAMGGNNISGGGTATFTSFVGALTGQADTVGTITGLAPDTATTQATQPNITSLGTLTGLTVNGDIRIDTLEGFFELFNGATRVGSIGLVTSSPNDVSLLTQDSSGGDGFRFGNSSNTTLFKIESGGKVYTGTTGLANMASGDFYVSGGSLILAEITTPTADTDKGKIYTKSDNILYFQDGSGSEKSIITSEGGTFTGDLQLGETSIKLDDTLSGDSTHSGITTSGISGVTTLAIGNLIYLNADDGRWELVDANLADGYDKQLGITLTVAADGAALEVLLYGKVRSAVFPVLTVGSPLYMSETAGDITHTAPVTSAAAVRKLGNALTAEDFMFNPSDTVIVLS